MYLLHNVTESMQRIEKLISPLILSDKSAAISLVGKKKKKMFLNLGDHHAIQG